MKSITVIIPTLNRQTDLIETVKSILQQCTIPQELIIVDQTKEPTYAKKLIETLINNYHLRDQVTLKYICDSNITSLAMARNRGIKEVTNDITLFLDDDVILMPNFIQSILEVYEECTEVDGVGGVMLNWKRSHLQKAFSTIFYIGPFRDMRIEIYSDLNKFENRNAIVTNKLDGCMASFKKCIFETYSFDENYVGYSPGEDMDFSYRASKGYKLVITPKAKMFHKWSHDVTNRENLIRRTQYHIGGWWYFFKKNITKNVHNNLCFLWLNFGFLLSAFASLIKQRSTVKLIGTLMAFKIIIFNKGKFSFLKN